MNLKYEYIFSYIHYKEKWMLVKHLSNDADFESWFDVSNAMKDILKCDLSAAVYPDGPWMRIKTLWDTKTWQFPVNWIVN